jgi:quercetin dioxygenase-like cupin family protein
MASLPAPRLVITSHTADGTSIISSDVKLAPFHPFGPNGSGFTIFHTSPTVPVSNSGPLEAPTTNAIPRPQPGGTFFGTSDFPPGAKSPMHRTLSVDYAVVLSGSIWMTLDGGDETEIKTGEFILQRGVNHLWENRGDVPCRVLFVMIGAEAVKMDDGTVLEETKIGPPKI